jgi:hypothetical protein
VELDDSAVGLAERVMIRLAGPEALRLSGRLTPSAALGCRADERQALELARELAHGDEAEAGRLIVELRARTARLLCERDRSREHGEIALQLVKRGSLSASELQSVRWLVNSRATSGSLK